MKAKKIALIVAGLVLLVACSTVAGIITHEYDDLSRLISTGENGVESLPLSMSMVSFDTRF